MSRAVKSELLSRLFAAYSRNLIRRKFNSLRANGFSQLVNATSRLPLIIYCNHSSWWDGIVVFQLMRLAKLDGFILMEERQYDHYPLFKKFGALPISRENPRRGLSDLKSAARVLCERRSSALAIFPQGEIFNTLSRPLKFETGIGRLVKFTGDCDTISLGMRFQFGSDFKPEVFARFGERRSFRSGAVLPAKTLTEELRRDLAKNLDNLNESIATGALSEFERLL